MQICFVSRSTKLDEAKPCARWECLQVGRSRTVMPARALEMQPDQRVSFGRAGQRTCQGEGHKGLLEGGHGASGQRQRGLGRRGSWHRRGQGLAGRLADVPAFCSLLASTRAVLSADEAHRLCTYRSRREDSAAAVPLPFESMNGCCKRKFRDGAILWISELPQAAQRRSTAVRPRLPVSAHVGHARLLGVPRLATADRVRAHVHATGSRECHARRGAAHAGFCAN